MSVHNFSAAICPPGSLDKLSNLQATVDLAAGGKS
jgi:hypothetical protein